MEIHPGRETMPETVDKKDTAWSEWEQLEPWSVVAAILPFFLGLLAIGAVIISFINFRQHPERKGRPLAWLGLVICVAHMAGMVYALTQVLRLT